MSKMHSRLVRSLVREVPLAQFLSATQLILTTNILRKTPDCLDFIYDNFPNNVR